MLKLNLLAWLKENMETFDKMKRQTFRPINYMVVLHI